jgi:hypothetical protein
VVVVSHDAVNREVLAAFDVGRSLFKAEVRRLVG